MRLKIMVDAGHLYDVSRAILSHRKCETLRESIIMLLQVTRF